MEQNFDLSKINYLNFIVLFIDYKRIFSKKTGGENNL